MADLKCPFQGPLITEDFGCALAHPVTVRNAPLIHCSSAAARERCERVHGLLKSVGLPAFGMDDDLLSTPHSVLQKIQYGGLLGLQALLHPADDGGLQVVDIDALMRALDEAEGLDRLPVEGLGAAMTGFELRRRRRRG